MADRSAISNYWANQRVQERSIKIRMRIFSEIWVMIFTFLGGKEGIFSKVRCLENCLRLVMLNILSIFSPKCYPLTKDKFLGNVKFLIFLNGEHCLCSIQKLDSSGLLWVKETAQELPADLFISIRTVDKSVPENSECRHSILQVIEVSPQACVKFSIFCQGVNSLVFMPGFVKSIL